MEKLQDFPPGPLMSYRARASFDWKKLKLSIESEDKIRYKSDVWNTIRDNQLFRFDTEPNLSEQRRMTFNRSKFLTTKYLSLYNGFSPEVMAFNEAVTSYDLNTEARTYLTLMLCNTLNNIGTEEHYKYIPKFLRSEMLGCFALTEAAHGSNVKGMRTRAAYDPISREFIIHTPDFEAAKMMIGALGGTATHAIVFATLTTPDGVDQGLNAFFVQIRCMRTLDPLPGVIIGDCGEKIAMNGIDNGFIMFNEYRVPKNTILNRIGDVDEHGSYVSDLNPRKRFGLLLGSLSGGRITVCGVSTCSLQKAVSIAIRYAAVRKQFGPPDSSEEFPILEYQQHQSRLIPYLAACFTFPVFTDWMTDNYTIYRRTVSEGLDDPELQSKDQELHMLSSCAKAAMTWITQVGIQSCREACGAYGYLAISGLGKLRCESDASCTYEGDNTLLIQQISDWLLSHWQKRLKGTQVRTVYGSANFLNNFMYIRELKANITSPQQTTQPKFILESYKWLICSLLDATNEKATKLQNQGNDSFTVKNDIQTYYAAPLSLIFIEHTMLDVCYNHADKLADNNCKNILTKLISLFGAWRLKEHASYLYAGGYFNGKDGRLLQDGIIALCSEITPESISLVDVIAPPDFIMNSVLGYSDGNVYENLEEALLSRPAAMARPEWWRTVLKYEQSKL